VIRLGLLGGSFDPVHVAHLTLARCALEQLALEEVWLVPAATAPHKRSRRQASIEHRIAMLELAVADQPGLSVSRIEADAGGVTYTANTLRRLRRDQPERELFFLVGADMLHDLPNWREPEEICRLATICAVRRPGSGEPDFHVLRGLAPPGRIERFRRHQVEMPPMDVSSTGARKRAAEGRDLEGLTPPPVARYIARHGLYRDASRDGWEDG